MIGLNPSQRNSGRVYPRRRLEKLAYIQLGPDNGGMLLDLSESGLQFQGVVRVSEGQQMLAKFSLPGMQGGNIEAVGLVAWANSSGKGGGLRFLNISTDARQRVKEWVFQEAAIIAETLAKTITVQGVVPKKTPELTPSIPKPAEISYAAGATPSLEPLVNAAGDPSSVRSSAPSVSSPDKKAKAATESALQNPQAQSRQTESRVVFSSPAMMGAKVLIPKSRDSEAGMRKLRTQTVYPAPRRVLALLGRKLLADLEAISARWDLRAANARIVAVAVSCTLFAAAWGVQLISLRRYPSNESVRDWNSIDPVGSPNLTLVPPELENATASTDYPRVADTPAAAMPGSEPPMTSSNRDISSPTFVPADEGAAFKTLERRIEPARTTAFAATPPLSAAATPPLSAAATPPLSAAATPPLIRPISVSRPDFVLSHKVKGHSGWVTGVAFSSDGQRLASGSWDRTIKFWDVPTGQELNAVGNSKMKEVQAVALSRDGRWLAAENSSNTITVWDAKTGREIHTLPSDKRLGIIGSSWVYSIAFSPDGRWLASSVDDKTVRLWDVGTGRIVRDLTGLRRSVMYAAFSPNGHWLATGHDNKTIEIWDLSSNEQEERRLGGHKQAIYAVVFSPDGRWLASASADKTIKLWDVAAGREVLTFTGHGGQVTCISFSPDGRWLASGSGDRTIRIWDVETGQEVRRLSGHNAPIYSVAFDSSGHWLASGSKDGTINSWRSTGAADQSGVR